MEHADAVDHHHHHHHEDPSSPSGGESGIEDTLVTDPVCGMPVNPGTSPHRHVHAGTAYRFCGNHCREKFAADPARYLSPKLDAEPSQPGAVYTCPMHPEVRQIGPGSCPICGMALEPLAPTAEPKANPELADISRRFWLALVPTVPLVVLDMAGIGPAWLQLVLAAPVVVWSGAPLFQRGWDSLVRRSLNMFSLIALGTGAAFLYSVAATILSGHLPVYFESAAVITVLVLLGQVLELRAREQTGSAIRSLLNLAPKIAHRIRPDGTDEDVPLDHIHAGDRLRIRPGAAVPTDGTVLEGSSSIDESMVTGESMPVAKHPDDPLIGGTVNGTGVMIMRAERVGADTMLARIVALVAEAQRTRAPIQRLADSVAGWFVPAVIAAAAVAFLVWSIWGPSPALAHALLAAVSVLIIACPCALGLATPMSIMVGVGKGARAGVLIRSAETLERLERVDTIVFDKTGTLTEGRPRVTSSIPDDVLGFIASLERASEHPIATAIVSAARDRGLSLSEPSDVQVIPGQGITGMVDGHRVAVGNARLISNAVAPLSASIDEAPPVAIAIADAIKATTPHTLERLRALGLHLVMLTGDARAIAEAVGAELGISEVIAEVLPTDKHATVQRLRASGRIVAMAGDGINDAPALAVADVGIAMGTGTEVAMSSAGITLVKGDLSGIVRAIALSRTTMRNIRQNLFLAFVYNAVCVPLAAGVLYPWFGILLSPMIAAAAMSLSSVSVIGNALRIR
jgi:Cu+-exporting ATPase